MGVNYPFSAIVGQDEMKLALLAAAVDPTMGGVLVLGDRGTGKSTAVRAMAADQASSLAGSSPRTRRISWSELATNSAPDSLRR